MTFFSEVIFKWFSYRNDALIFDMIMINLSEMIVWPSFGAVSIRRKQDRNGTGDRVGGAVRQGIPGLQETKTGETAGKVAETANGWAMPCRAMTSPFNMKNDLLIQMIDDIIYFKMIFSYDFISEEISQDLL